MTSNRYSLRPALPTRLNGSGVGCYPSRATSIRHVFRSRAKSVLARVCAGRNAPNTAPASRDWSTEQIAALPLHPGG